MYRPAGGPGGALGAQITSREHAASPQHPEPVRHRGLSGHRIRIPRGGKPSWVRPAVRSRWLAGFFRNPKASRCSRIFGAGSLLAASPARPGPGHGQAGVGRRLERARAALERRPGRPGHRDAQRADRRDRPAGQHDDPRQAGEKYMAVEPEDAAEATLKQGRFDAPASTPRPSRISPRARDPTPPRWA